MQQLTTEAIINEPVEKVWQYYTEPAHITKWAFADDSWHAPKAENDLRVGGRFVTRMEAKDGSAGFDFGGTYDEVVPNKKIAYTMDFKNGETPRKAVIEFQELGNSTHVKVSFDPENENSHELQVTGWQGILNNFKAHVEGN